MENKDTVHFKFGSMKENETRVLLDQVYVALKEKGYNPICQLVGYIMSGDPTYITSHNNARSLVTRLERDELLEDILRYYLEHNNG